jgi:hypothetical protein
VPHRCCSCQEQNVTKAYHAMCDNCANQKGVCAKCLKPKEIIPANLTKEEEAKEENLALADIKYLFFFFFHLSFLHSLTYIFEIDRISIQLNLPFFF